MQLTKNCVGFSAPVAARAFAYLHIGIYESQVEMFPAYRSLEGQLQGYERKTFLEKSESVYWPHVLNRAFHQLVSLYYENMPPSLQASVQQRYRLLFNTYSRHLSKNLRARSESYAKAVVEEVFHWSRSDQAHEAYKRNHPRQYTPAGCDGCWTSTVPGYLPALQPFWGETRSFLAGSDSVTASMPAPQYATDTGSAFYKDARELVMFYRTLNREQENIARYWDDSPGYSGTPAGHLFSLAGQLSRNLSLGYDRKLHLFTMLGIAIHEANIECWRLKYRFNLLRPVSYIQRYLSPRFNTVLITPPFPEFPSGHSFQSGAAARVFISFFSDSLSFSDSSLIHRKDINGSPRSFSSFSALAREISDSRYYGGIHFRRTLDLSLDYGKKMGDHCLGRIQFLK